MILGFGNNRFGQIGISNGEETISVPTVIPFEEKRLVRVACTAAQTFMVTEGGLLYSW
jgi:alpha-tubulin suppressor-like RCC1 family protein